MGMKLLILWGIISFILLILSIVSLYSERQLNETKTQDCSPECDKNSICVNTKCLSKNVSTWYYFIPFLLVCIGIPILYAIIKVIFSKPRMKNLHKPVSIF